MFESALVESSARIRTRARYWMLASLLFNLSLAGIAALMPLLYPQALPKSMLVSHFELPQPPAKAAPKTPAQQVAASHKAPPALDAHTAPTQIPHTIDRVVDPPPASIGDVVVGSMTGAAGGTSDVIGAMGISTPTIVPTVKPPAKPERQRVSGGVMAGQLLVKTQPVYPVIARAAHVSGTVVLHAIIAKDGTIQNLAVITGSEMLRAAALDAVRQWRYRPYTLTGEPTEVETTITVNFNLGS